MRTGVSDIRLVKLAENLRHAARAARQRRLLVLAGEAAWARETAAAIAADAASGRALWIGSESPPGVERVDGAKAIQLLGGECDLVIFDAHAGFDADAFGAVSGTLAGGGIFVLLTPPLAEWAAYADPELARLTPEGCAVPARSRFIGRLVALLASEPGVVVATSGAIPEIGEVRPAAQTAPAIDDSEQQRAVAAVVQAGTGRARRPVVLTADRGRGKSAALGMAAAELIAAGHGPVVVTAPRFEAAARVFEHAGEAALEFRPPDALAHAPPGAEVPRLLLVDEAAGIPAPLLAAMLERYPRIAFATTIHGYEGTGRGFELRFQKTLAERTPDWKAIRLERPIRWAPDDPLERLVARILLLDAPSAPGAAVSDIVAGEAVIEKLDRDALALDEGLLGQVYGLLVSAHYRTRPFDLRLLLDGPAVAVYVMRAGGHVVGTALVADEGGLDPALGAQIWAGRRRPHGHLMPETLAVQAGLAEAPSLRCARVLRIAIHPAAQGRGLGTALIGQIRADVSTEFDCLGTSFGATPALLQFWRGCGLHPASMGMRRGRATGERAALMMQGLSAAGATCALAAGARLQADLPVLLGGPLRDLEPALVAALMACGTPAQPTLGDIEWRELAGFAFAARGFEPALRALYALVEAALADPAASAALTPGERDSLIVKVLQQRSWADAAAALGCSGRGEVIECLRAGVGHLLVHYTQVLRLALDI